MLALVSADSRYWIGLDDRDTEGTFTWIDGSEVSLTLRKLIGALRVVVSIVIVKFRSNDYEDAWVNLGCGFVPR